MLLSRREAPGAFDGLLVDLESNGDDVFGRGLEVLPGEKQDFRDTFLMLLVIVRTTEITVDFVALIVFDADGQA